MKTGSLKALVRDRFQLWVERTGLFNVNIIYANFLWSRLASGCGDL
jgi:hypothetical protein